MQTHICTKPQPHVADLSISSLYLEANLSSSKVSALISRAPPSTSLSGLLLMCFIHSDPPRTDSRVKINIWDSWSEGVYPHLNSPFSSGLRCCQWKSTAWCHSLGDVKRTGQHFLQMESIWWLVVVTVCSGDCKAWEQVFVFVFFKPW